jgi:hypothetical protein
LLNVYNGACKKVSDIGPINLDSLSGSYSNLLSINHIFEKEKEVGIIVHTHEVEVEAD